MPAKAFFMVSVGGLDITGNLASRLISMTISDKEGTQNDTCNITLDDKDGAIIMPRTGDPIAVVLGWEGGAGAQVFMGTVDEVKSSGSRSGRELTISAKGLDTKSKAKQPQQKHMDGKKTEEALNEAGKLSGHTVRVDPSLNVKRDYWGMNDESFVHFGERIAQELGGVFKIKGKQAILADKTGGSISGAALAIVTATWGGNLISWDMTPRMGRMEYSAMGARWYDLAKAKWNREKESVKNADDGAGAEHNDRFSRADKDEAKGKAKNHAKDSEKEKGGGSAVIDGTASAIPGGTCVIAGARPGIDGPWRIEEVQHEFSRSGWTTSLTLKMPGEGTGSDSRGAE
jgi:Bacteriophage probable baseplate hub protein